MKFRLKRNVYIIITGILILAIAVQITNSQIILKFNQNQNVTRDGKPWKPVIVDAALIAPSGDPYCLVYDSMEEYSIGIQENAKRVLGYMQKPKKEFDLQAGDFHPQGCAAVIISTTKLSLIKDLDELAAYVEAGGYVFSTVILDLDDGFYRLYRKMGILAVGDIKVEHGLVLTENVLIGEKDLEIPDEYLENTSLSLEVDDRCRVLIRGLDGLPIMWDIKYGKGKFMVFNGTMLQSKMNRGLLAGGISLLEPDFIYPIFNTKVVYIDDFPAPLPRGINMLIYPIYRKDTPSFYREVWWPDMLKAARRYNLKYTAVVIQSYNDQVTPPFTAPIDEDAKGLISYGREVVKSGGEIGLHGYNHQSLQLNQKVADEYEYNSWKSVDTMAEAIKTAVDFVARSFTNYHMITYVPPSNVLSSEGREALKRGFPAMSIIASLYQDDSSNVSYTQEYEIAKDGILELPRITSGYYEFSFDRWSEANVVTSLGIFSHFVHPDDVTAKDRNNNMTWEQLYEEFAKRMDRTEKTYPWLRSFTASEAGIETAQRLTSRVNWTRKDDSISGRIENFGGDSFKPAYFILRTERKFRKLEHCKLEKIDEGTYLVMVTNPEFEIEMG